MNQFFSLVTIFLAVANAFGSISGSFDLPGNRLLHLRRPETGGLTDQRLEPELLWSSNIGKSVFVAFSPDGRYLASSAYGSITIWEATSGKLIVKVPSEENRFRPIAFHPSKNLLVAGAYNGGVSLISVPSGDESDPLYFHRDVVMAVAFSPDGTMIASGSGAGAGTLDNSVKVWNIDSSKLLYTLRGHTFYVLSVAFSPDSKRLVTGSQDHTARVWGLRHGMLEKILKADSWVNTVTFSPNQKFILGGLFNGNLISWDSNTGAKVDSKFFGQGIWSIAYSHDRKYIGFGIGSIRAQIVDAKTSSIVHDIEGNGQAWGVAFSPKENLFAVARNSVQESVTVWRVK